MDSFVQSAMDNIVPIPMPARLAADVEAPRTECPLNMSSIPARAIISLSQRESVADVTGL